jgi:hypothetical protein
MKALQFLKILGNIYPATQCDIPEEINLEYICFTATSRRKI